MMIDNCSFAVCEFVSLCLCAHPQTFYYFQREQMAKENKLLLPHWKPLVELEANVTLHCVAENVVHSSVTLVQCLH